MRTQALVLVTRGLSYHMLGWTGAAAIPGMSSLLSHPGLDGCCSPVLGCTWDPVQLTTRRAQSSTPVTHPRLFGLALALHKPLARAVGCTPRHLRWRLVGYHMLDGQGVTINPGMSSLLRCPGLVRSPAA